MALPLREPEPIERSIARYEILGELGHGGMAVVHRARDPRLDREVAIKVLHPHLARDAESRARFEREARAAARLRHPNIVEVYEFDATEDQSYMVTELLEGPTLRAHFEEQREIPAEVVACVGAVLCDALGCAHELRVIHRDVKPDNVMLHRGHLKLTDFGIAHIVDAREMTATGQVLGSPAHMSPEQIEGTAVDARTDLFALGTVLYFLATGKLPFNAPTAHALLKKILDGDFADPIRVNPAMGERFAAILRRAMSRNASERYQTARAFKDALLGFVAEVEWTLPDRELEAYFQDPAAVRAALREKLLAMLPRRGVEARRAGDVPAAMGYFNRALALDPGNVKVLALVRSAARRRQVVRGLKAAGITVGVALSTAGLVLALAPREELAHPILTVPVDPGNPRENTPLAHANATPTAVSEAPPDVLIAAPEALPTAASAPGPTRPVRPRTPEAAPAPPAPRRAVNFTPRQRGVMYSVDGSEPTTWDAQHSTLNLTVGRHSFVLIPVDSPEYERLEVAVDVPPGEGTWNYFPSLRRARPSSVSNDVVLVRDGGPPTL